MFMTRPPRRTLQALVTAVLIDCALLIPLAPAFAQTGSQVGGRRNIAILVYDGVQVLDFAGAFEVFSRLNRDNVFLVSPTGALIKTWRGVGLTPTFSIVTAPKP